MVKRAGPLPPEAWVIAAEDVPATGQHLRFAAPSSQTFGGLDVAVTDYEPAQGAGPRISLVGVVHVGDSTFYQQLEKLLAGFDIVLFEAVKERDLDVAAWWEAAKSKETFAAAFQTRIVTWLGMAHQLDAIDYSASNFVHADMDLETFIAEGGGELLPGIELEPEGEEGDPRRPGVGREGTSLPSELKGMLDGLQALGDIVFSDNSPFQSMARLEFAKALGGMDLVDAIQMHPRLGTLILDRRNEVALGVLSEVLRDRAEAASIAVFYGAAHMPGMERELLGRFGYKRVGGRWHRAWALRKRRE